MDLSHRPPGAGVRPHQRGPEGAFAPGRDGAMWQFTAAVSTQLPVAARRETHSLMPDGLQVAFRSDNGKGGRGRATGEGPARLQLAEGFAIMRLNAALLHIHGSLL